MSEPAGMSGVILCPSLLSFLFEQPNFVRAYCEAASKGGRTLLVTASAVAAVSATLNERQRFNLMGLMRQGGFLALPLDPASAVHIGAIASVMSTKEATAFDLAAAHAVLAARQRRWKIATRTPHRYGLFADVKLVDLA